MTLRVAVAQFRPTKGNYTENLQRVGGALAAVSQWQPPPNLVVFPETFMSGLFVEAGVRECAVTAGDLVGDIAAMHEAAGAPPVDIVVGFYEEYQNRYFNSAAYMTLGGSEPLMRHVHRKVFLPTYGVFDEKRFVSHGRSVNAFDTAWGRAAILICEDAWHSISGAIAALEGAQVILVPAAAPARGIGPSSESRGSGVLRPASSRAWERMICRIAEEHGVFLVLAQPVGFEGGKAFQGGSAIVAPDGDVKVSAPIFEEAMIVSDLDLDAISRVRSKDHTFGDLEAQFQGVLDSAGSTPDELEFAAATRSGNVSEAPAPFECTVFESSHASDDPLAIEPDLATRWLEAFIEDEVVRCRGFDKVVIGLSGGVDSSLAATLAARALGPQNVIGVRMPYSTSSSDSLAHAAIVAGKLGIRLETVDISAAVDAYLSATDDNAGDTRRGNVMARMRMITLFDLAAKYRALPLGSGNKTERLFGYFTWHGDDSPPINPLGDLYKTQVWELARHLGVPDEIVSKAPSADLIQGQTDEADLGISYARADRILHWFLSGYRADQIVDLGFSSDDVQLVRDHLNRTHWKRHLPTVAMVSNTAIGESYLRPVDY